MANELTEYQSNVPVESGVAVYGDYQVAETFPVESSAYAPAEMPVEDSREYQQISDLRPYKFWDNKSKGIFNSQPDSVKRAWIATQKRADARAYQTTEELKKLYEPFNALAEVLAPYVDAILSTGMTIPEYIQRTIEADKQLTADPVEFICALMDAKDIYQTDIEQAFEGFYKRRAMKAELSPIKQEVQKLKTDLEYKEATKEQQKYDDMVYKFYSQKDSRGNLIYPYAADLSELIISLIDSTGETDLHKLYNMAYSAALAKQQVEDSDKAAASPEQNFALNDDQADYVEPQPKAGGVRSVAKEKEEDRRFYKNLYNNVAAKYGIRS